MLHEPHGQFMLSLYYLKFHFGDKFDYALWKTESKKSLLDALKELGEYAFKDNEPVKYIQKNNSDVMRLYHKYMGLSRIESYNLQEIKAKNIREDYLFQARAYLTGDLYPLYWLGILSAEKKEWQKGLAYFQDLFTYDLAFSMEGLPLAYQKAALCAENLGDQSLADEYNRIANALHNDFNITVDRNRGSYIGYRNGAWMVSDM